MESANKLTLHIETGQPDCPDQIRFNGAEHPKEPHETSTSTLSSRSKRLNSQVCAGTPNFQES